MAYTKTIPIKATLNKVFDYITDPTKTDGKLLVSSFACSPETAKIEFEFTSSKAQEVNKNNVIARHLIQSFAYSDDITPEEAHEIGKQLADEVLKGEHEYVIATHIDKGYVHNHIVFNSVNFQTHKRYRSTKKTPYDIMRISDRLCTENGLSVIPPNKNKQRNKYTYPDNPTSYKEQIKQTLNHCLKNSKSYEDFIQQVKLLGIDVREEKELAFKLNMQKNYSTLKVLGQKYSKDNIIKTLEFNSKRKTNINRKRDKISLFIDMQEADKKGIGYTHWAKRYNVKQTAKIISFLSTNNITNYQQFTDKIEQLEIQFNNTQTNLKALEKRLASISVLIKNHDTYYETLETKYGLTDEQRLLHKTVKKQIGKHILKPEELEKLKEQHNKLLKEKQTIYSDFKAVRKDFTEHKLIKQNLDTILNNSDTDSPKRHRKNRQKSR